MRKVHERPELQAKEDGFKLPTNHLFRIFAVFMKRTYILYFTIKIRDISQGLIYTVQFLSHATTAYDIIPIMYTHHFEKVNHNDNDNDDDNDNDNDSDNSGWDRGV